VTWPRASVRRRPASGGRPGAPLSAAGAAVAGHPPGLPGWQV